MQFNISVLESESRTSCKNLASISTDEFFPSIDSALLDASNQGIEKNLAWDVIVNNSIINGVPMCDKTSLNPMHAKCIVEVYGDIHMNESSIMLSMLFSLPLTKIQKEKLNEAKFFLLYENAEFNKYLFLFRITVSIISLISFSLIFRRLFRFSPKDWLSIHKWILILLLTQTLLDNTFAILNDIYESKALQILNELGKNIHFGLLLYFWTTVFDQILIHHSPSDLFAEWAEKIKVILLTSLFTLNFCYNTYIKIEALDDGFQNLFQLRYILTFIKLLITFLKGLYGLYFIILTVIFLKRVREGKIVKDRTLMILYSFSCVSFFVTTISLITSPFSDSNFQYFAARGFISIYTITVGLLYLPQKKTKQKASELDMTAMNEREEIIKSVYGAEEDPINEPKSPESESEKQKKKLIWEKIQTQVEKENDEPHGKAGNENEEYIYL